LRDAHGKAVEGVRNGLSQGAQYGRDALRNGFEGLKYGNGLLNSAQQSPIAKLRDNLVYTPGMLVDSFMGSTFGVPMIVLQIIFAIIYYCTVVSNYPYWNGPTPNSCRLQQEVAPCATTSTSASNCFLAWCCPQARAAHTFDKTGILDYWCGLVAMFLCPFCTLCWANACTDLNPKLGGQPSDIFTSSACTFCCPCCVIAQDAESLDAATGTSTEICGVSQGAGAFPMQPYGGMPGQQMMYARY